MWSSQAFYTVSKVIDGDTFVTKENQYVRFDKVDAPEIDNCLGLESKAELEKLLLGKKVYIKVNYVEKEWKRLVGSVYTTDGDIQEIMLSKGLATYRGGGSKALQTASNKARSEKIGVYSERCTQLTNPTNPKCNIKGNIRREKFYHYPGCSQYTNTEVQLYLGEKWFCSVREAEKDGFVKGADCK